jgi:hypothetical protein
MSDVKGFAEKLNQAIRDARQRQKPRLRYYRPHTRDGRVLHVYMAGRMEEPCWRPFDVYHDDYADHIPKSALRHFNDLEIIYTGPFRNRMCQHHRSDMTCMHGLDGARGADSDVFERSLAGIRGCDVLFAYFDDFEAYGTLVEVGLAHAMGKCIVVGFCELGYEQRYDGIGGDDNGDDGVVVLKPDTRSRRYPSDELWFAAACAEQVFRADTAEGVLRLFSDWLRKQQPADEDGDC